MRVAMLADELFASRESALLARLAVGLVGEGLRVVHCLHERTAALPLAPGMEGMAAGVVMIPPGGLFTGARPRAARLHRRLAETFGKGRAPDLVHVFGGSLWHLGLRLAEEAQCPCAIEVWRGGQVPRAAALGRRDHERPPPTFFAPDKNLERALLAMEPSLAVRATPWGVHAPSELRPILPSGRCSSAIMVGTGRDARTFNAAFEGLAQVASRAEGFMIFADTRAVRNAETWRLARSLSVLDRLSLIENLEARRDVLLHGDVMVLPDAKGEQRTILLEAMAGGMLVVAMADPLASTLLPNQTARLVERADPREWAAAVEGLLTDREGAAALAASARAFVRRERRASDHVKAVLDAYAWMTAGEPIGVRRADAPPRP
ncbi:MAG: glycosyltransferase [Phycisphaerae bacterium]|nr:glycosyltransferase [Phycisphaerae bacterium]